MGNRLPQITYRAGNEDLRLQGSSFPTQFSAGKPFPRSKLKSWDPETSAFHVHSQASAGDPRTWHSTASLKDAGSVLKSNRRRGSSPEQAKRAMSDNSTPPHCWVTPHHPQGIQGEKVGAGQLAACWQSRNKGGLGCISPPESRMEGKRTHMPGASLPGFKSQLLSQETSVHVLSHGCMRIITLSWFLLEGHARKNVLIKHLNSMGNIMSPEHVVGGSIVHDPI